VRWFATRSVRSERSLVQSNRRSIPSDLLPLGTYLYSTVLIRAISRCACALTLIRSMGLAVCLILAIFPALAPPQCRKVLAVHLLDLVIYMSLHRRETSFLPYARPVLEARSRPSATSRGPPSLTRSSCCTEGGGIRDSIRLRFAPYLTFRYSN